MRMRRRRVLLAILFAMIVAAGYACVPRTAKLRGFDPTALAHLETTMWRQYYEHRKLSLAFALYRTSRSQYGFSPLDSVRLARHAADAAIVFKDSTSDESADAAFPALRKHFQVIRDHSDEVFDVDQATRLELNWWKIRRHGVGPAEYGHAIARASACVYNIPADRLENYGQLRAAAMDYRDRRGAAMTDADWNQVENLLQQSFASLKSVLIESPRQH